MGLRDRKLADLLPTRAAARLRKFRREVETALPGRVADVVLFGSRARGEARRGSDYDVAVFVHDLTERRKVGHLLSDTAYPYMVSGFHISPIAVPADFHATEPRVPLSYEIARDGVSVR